jgi:hypothetical protein
MHVEQHIGHNKMTPRKEARNLLIMLGSAFFIAFVSIILLVRCYGASGTHNLGNLLVSPEQLQNDFTQTKKKNPSFLTHQAEFILRDRFGKNWARYPVTAESYEIFFHEVKNENSIPKPDEMEMHLFEKNAPSALIFLFSPRQGNKNSIREIQFLEGSDLYRVHFENDSSSEWIYFRYPGIFDFVTRTFASEKAPS